MSNKRLLKIHPENVAVGDELFAFKYDSEEEWDSGDFNKGEITAIVVRDNGYTFHLGKNHPDRNIVYFEALEELMFEVVRTLPLQPSVLVRSFLGLEEGLDTPPATH